MSFTYDSAGEVITETGTKRALEASSVAFGSDPFPYISLDSTEQAAGATAAAGSLAGAICLALGPESGGAACLAGAGLGFTIVAIAVAHGVCPNNQNYRIYILSLEGQCRND
ncbi:hypothetical protein [Clavibacter michiganensis]|uniref:hypothetical protein n=1 Tax=Clavibacter michiganensis TaxID=28447 RepID=UPI00105573D2|nr:hypothetical protein [Clavibacter michiganensis]